MPGIDISSIQQSKSVSKKTKGLDAIISFLNKDISLSKELPDKKKEAFYSDIYMLLSSNLDIKTILELVEQGQSRKKDELLVKEIKEMVIAGIPLSSALEKTGKFSKYETLSIKIGEETGKTVEVARQLLTFFKNKVKQKRLLINALTYPSVVVTTSILAIVFLLKYVVPMFAGVFKRFGGELPKITKFILKVSALIS